MGTKGRNKEGVETVRWAQGFGHGGSGWMRSSLGLHLDDEGCGAFLNG